MCRKTQDRMWPGALNLLLLPARIAVRESAVAGLEELSWELSLGS